MSVRVLFFGLVAEQQGKREVEVVVSSETMLSKLIFSLGIDSDCSFMVALNQQQVSDFSTVISDGDEIAIMPPFSGG